jgi:uncharacterized protein YneF (UPF0154 family)
MDLLLIIQILTIIGIAINIYITKKFYKKEIENLEKEEDWYRNAIKNLTKEYSNEK